MIRTHDLRLHAGQKTLVDALTWQAQPGECWCIIGRNGVGKSTLLRTLTGLREPDAGKVWLQTRLLSDWPLLLLAQKRGYLPQSRTDAFGFSAMETVLAARHPYHGDSRWESSQDEAMARAAMQMMEVSDLAQRDVRTLSGGERQRVAIAALLAQDADLMLLDEPANGLDLAHQASLVSLLSGLCRDRKKTIVMTGHDLNLAHRLATHVLLLMAQGQWHAGTKEDMMTETWLTRCLGYPVERLVHHDRVVYVPSV